MLKARYKSGIRYRAINLNSLSQYGTIEFRIFPNQYSIIECENTIKWLIGTTEKIIKRLKKSRKRIYTAKTESINFSGYELIKDLEIQIKDIKIDKDLKKCVV
jgi:hypothetical protein